MGFPYHEKIIATKIWKEESLETNVLELNDTRIFSVYENITNFLSPNWWKLLKVKVIPIKRSAHYGLLVGKFDGERGRLN